MLSRPRNHFLIISAALLISLASSQIGWAQDNDLQPPTRENMLVSRLIATLMENHHLSKLPLDDTISERAFDIYIKGLDPAKTYFMQSDIQEFQALQDEIDDNMKQGDFSVALKIFDRFLERVDQRTQLAIELVDAPHDFTIDEEMTIDNDALDYAQTEEDAQEMWRKRIKYSLLLMRTDDQRADEDQTEDTPKEASPLGTPQDRLRKRYESFARRMHQMDTEDVVERYLTAITSSFDPHTTYFSSRSFENFRIHMGLELEGIGATLQATDDGYTVIKKIVPGGAAATQGGLKVEDKIVAVGQGTADGEKADPTLIGKHGSEFVDVTGMRLDDVVAMIRGTAGSVVRLSVMSENDAELHTVTIVREKIKLEESAAKGEVFEQGTRPDGTPQKIGVIELPSFYADMGSDGGGRSTTVDVRKILDRFNAEGVDALVLDLRRNGGGSLPEAIDCTGLFIDRGPVVQVKNPYGTIEELNDEARGMAWKKPLVVVVSKFSASASEIFAGAVQDYGRGLVVGDSTTFGKGTVQSLRNLSEIILRSRDVDFGALKITTQQFYRPNGDSTQKRGVLSDIVLPSFTDNMEDITEADLDYPIEFDRVPRASFTPVDMVDSVMIDNLRDKSNGRLESNEDFQDLSRKIDRYLEQKKLKSVSINEQKFMARRKELSAEREDERELERQIDGDNSIDRNFYLDEVLKITADYVEMLNQKRG